MPIETEPATRSEKIIKINPNLLLENNPKLRDRIEKFESCLESLIISQDSKEIIEFTNTINRLFNPNGNCRIYLEKVAGTGIKEHDKNSKWDGKAHILDYAPEEIFGNLEFNLIGTGSDFIYNPCVSSDQIEKNQWYLCFTNLSIEIFREGTLEQKEEACKKIRYYYAPINQLKKLVVKNVG